MAAVSAAETSPFASQISPYFLSPLATSNDGASAIDEYAANPRFQDLQSELRSILLEGVTSDPPSRAPSPERTDVEPILDGNQQLLATLSSLKSTVSLNRSLQYLQVWVIECAPWLDMFDQQRNFGLRVPILAQSSPSILFALLALSARQMERKSGTKKSHDSLELYQQSIACLTPALNAHNPEVLITACILCVLEMMSVSPRDWRRHLEGCAGLFRAFAVNGLSGGLLQAVFWCYARMDLNFATIADGAESTVLPVEHWTPFHDGESNNVTKALSLLEAGEMFQSKSRNNPDMYANWAIYLGVRVCDLLSRRSRYLDLGESNGCDDDAFDQEWSSLWQELMTWYTKRPSEIMSAKELSALAAGAMFPSILFPHWAAISSNQWYHTSCILMLEMRPHASEISQCGDISQCLWHARRIVGISMTNPHKGCLNNAIQPLFTAGKYFSHKEEHTTVVDILTQIETRTGWGSKWRIKDLETIWGYPKGTVS